MHRIVDKAGIRHDNTDRFRVSSRLNVVQTTMYGTQSHVRSIGGHLHLSYGDCSSRENELYSRLCATEKNVFVCKHGY